MVVYSPLHYAMFRHTPGRPCGSNRPWEIQNTATVRNVKKDCGWLYEMSKTDDHSKRAWGIYSRLAARHGPGLVLLSTSISCWGSYMFL